MGRGLSPLQHFLLLQDRTKTPSQLAGLYPGGTTPQAICRALSRLQERGVIPLTDSSAKWELSVNENSRTVQSDALDFFARYPDRYFDQVFGSPPFTNARIYRDNGEPIVLYRNVEEWVAWMVEVYKAALRCCKGLVAFVVGGRTRNFRWDVAPAKLMVALDQAGICLRPPPLYERVGIPGSGGPDWFRSDYESVVCVTHGGQLPWSDNTACGHAPKCPPGGDMTHRQQDGTRVGHATRGYKNGDTIGGKKYKPPEKANPGNVIQQTYTAEEVAEIIEQLTGEKSNMIHCKVGGGLIGDKEAHENEAPFPELLAQRFIRSCCPPGGLVCDSFAGSGTTAKVALQYGRRFLGCDLRQSQIELSGRRMRRRKK
jgi:DNA modification methylase